MGFTPKVLYANDSVATGTTIITVPASTTYHIKFAVLRADDNGSNWAIEYQRLGAGN